MNLPPANSWVGRFILLLGGGLMAAALPPWHFLPAILAFALLDRTSLRWDGVWLFAFGYHVVGLHWIAIAFYAEAERFGALAVPGVIALSAILASITAASVWLTAKLIGREGWRRPLSLSLGWTLAELLRGPWGTQFPWNPTSLIWSISDVTMQPIAWLGSEAFGLLTLFAVLALGRAVVRRSWQPAVLALVIVLSFPAIGYWRLPSMAEPEPGQPLLQLVQANIAQHHKWDAEKRRQWFFRHADLSKSHEGPPDILIWPESSVPYSLEETADAGRLIAENLTAGGIALVGSDFVDRSQDPVLLHNSVYALDHTGSILGRYDKVQLVPFGEFLPLRSWLSPFGLEALAVGSVDFTPGQRRQRLVLPNLPSPGPLVCYEAVFAGMATAPGDRPEWLLNVTNDAWFGLSAGPYQHMNMARMRSVETGLPLVRAANTGISVITDSYGRILTSLALGESGTIRHRLPEPLPSPPPIGAHPGIAWMLFFITAGAIWAVIRAFGLDGQ